MTLEYRNVDLQLQDCTLQVEGRAYGELAVTPYLYPPLHKGIQPNRWNITHIRSGRSVVDRVTAQKKAWSLAKTLNEKFDFSTVDENGLGMPEKTRRQVREFLEGIGQ